MVLLLSYRNVGELFTSDRYLIFFDIKVCIVTVDT